MSYSTETQEMRDAYDAWLDAIEARMPKPLEVIETRPGNCECGGDAVNAAFHSDWCPKHENT